MKISQKYQLKVLRTQNKVKQTHFLAMTGSVTLGRKVHFSGTSRTGLDLAEKAACLGGLFMVGISLPVEGLSSLATCPPGVLATF